MSLTEAVARIREVFPAMEVSIGTTPVSLAALLEDITDVQCTAGEFASKARLLSTEEARTLITATLHRGMAYSVEIMPIEEARSLSSQLVSAAGEGAQFFSNCHAADEINGIGSWTFMVTSHTFESVLYCVGKYESALLVAIDED